MIIDKTKNTLMNVKWGWINRLATTLMPFIIQTIIIKTIGSEYVGLNGLFTSILSVLSISELGISSAIVCNMYKPIAEDNTEEICALMRLYRTAYRIIAGVVAVIGLVILFFLDDLIKGPVNVDINIYVLFMIYLANSVLGYSLFSYRTCLFLAHQRNAVSFRVQTATIILQYILQILVLVLSKNYYIYVAMLLIPTVLQNIILAYKSRVDYPNYACRGSVSKENKAQIKKQIGGLVIGKVNVTARNAADSIFVSAFIGLAAGAIYSNYMYPVSAVVGFIVIISTSMVAGVGNSIALNSIEDNYENFKRYTFASQWFVGICAICVMCLVQPFMEIWVGTELMLKDGMAVICGLYVLVGQCGIIRGTYNEALGLWWKMRLYSMFDIPINIIMNYIFVSKWGIYGIVLATILCLACYGIPVASYILFKNYFGKEKYVQYLKETYLYIFTTCCIGAVTFAICHIDVGNVYLQFFYCGVVCVVLPNILYWLLYNKNEKYIYFWTKIKGILRNKFTK